MSILEVTAVPFTQAFPGGGERYPAVLAAELARSESVVVSYARGKTPDPAGDGRLLLPGCHLDAPPFLTPANPLPVWGTLSSIRTYLETHRSEVEFVHVHNLRTAFGTTWVMLSALRRSGAHFKIILTDHAARFAPFPKLPASLVDYYVAVSHHSLRQLNSWAKHPGIVLPPPVPQIFVEGPPPPAYEERDIDLLYLGRIVPWKRPDKVLELASEIERQQGLPVRVTIAGSPLQERYWEDLQGQAAEYSLRGGAQFVRRPTDLEVLRLYDRARLFVLLSMGTDREGRVYRTPELAPASVIEAAARGTPGIVSNLPGVDEQVVRGVTGLVVDPDRLRDSAASIGAVLRDARRWSELSKSARDLAVRDRNPREFGERMARFLQDIRGGRA